MTINSDFDVLLIAVSQLGETRENALARIAMLREEMAQAEGILKNSEETALALGERLKGIALRAGYLRKEQLDESLDLIELELLVLEGMSIAKNSELPANVVVLPLRKPIQTPSQLQKNSNESMSLEQAVHDVLASIPQRGAETLRLIFGIGTEDGKKLQGFQRFSQEYAARKLNVSQPTISKTLQKALRQLKHPLRSDLLRPFCRGQDSISSREELLLYMIFGGLDSLEDLDES